MAGIEALISYVCVAFLLPCDVVAKLVVTETVTYDSGVSQWTSTVKNRPFDAFIGLPYAEPPLGDLRFALPKPSNLKGHFHAGVDDNPHMNTVCTQMDFQERVDGQEDCLVLHLYAPENATSKALPVIVWIHGGGFFAGGASPSFYGPDHFMDHDIILIAINYRLGALAFTTLENDLMPGNLGIHDLVLALNWVQQNVAYFGGDPNKVTIMGESAGGMAVSYLLITPHAKGLFHRAIVQSGPIISSFTHWDKRPNLYARRLAKDFGCHGGDDSEIINCLRKIEGRAFAENTKHFLHHGWIGPNVWKPYIDGKSPGNNVTNPLFLDEPEVLLKSGSYNQVPVIIGTNTGEGSINVVGYLDGRANFSEIDEKWAEMYGPLVLFHRSFDETSQRDVELAKTIKDLYFGSEPISRDNMMQFVRLSGDHMFYGGTEVITRALVSSNSFPTYRYMYSQKGSFTLVDLFLLNRVAFGLKIMIKYATGRTVLDSNMGVCHSDELFQIFNPHKIPLNSLITETDKLTSKRMLSLFVNFASSGNPNVGLSVDGKWEPTSAPDYEYLDINGEDDTLSMGYDPEYKARAEFWVRIIEEMNERYTRIGLSNKPPLTSADIESTLFSRTNDEL